MHRKILIASLLFISIITFSNLAWSATAVDLTYALPGDYSVDAGKMKLVLKVVIDSQKFLDITINLANFSIFGGKAFFSFSYDPAGYALDGNIYPGQFSLKTSTEPGSTAMLTGGWYQSGSTKFTIDSDLKAFYDSLMTSLGSLGTDVSLNKGDYTSSFTGTISKDWLSIKGNYKFTIPLYGVDAGDTGGVGSVDLTGTSLSISGSYVATYVYPPLAASHAPSISSVQKQSTERDLVNSLAQTIKTAIVNATQKK